MEKPLARRSRPPRSQSASTSRRAFVAFALLGLGGAPAVAQSIRGEVFSATTLTPLPYSRVVLQPGFDPRFTTETGRFVFADVRPGTYRLTLKHIGYLPFDTVLTVSSGHDIVIRAAPSDLAVELPPITIAAGRSCIAPGPPDSVGGPQLAALFGQLREHANRYMLLADAYPFRHWVMRRERFGRAGSTEAVAYRSDRRRRYAPGRLVSGSGAAKQLHIPSIADLADSAFHAVHCFSFGGVERLEDVPHYRVDFLAAASLSRPDVDGTAWLDSVTFALRRLDLRLTRPGQAVRGIASVEVTAEFNDILPFLSLPNFVRSVTAFTDRKGVRVEEQTFMRIEFLRGQPGDP